jgi:pyrroline-5-carboxylate reductase
MVNGQIISPAEVGVSDPDQRKRDELAHELGIQSLPDNRVAATAEMLLLAVKPQIFPQIIEPLQEHLHQHCLVVSVMAGIPVSVLEQAFPQRPVVRTMPNTPALVGAGITALSGGQLTTPDHLEQVRRLFETVGIVITVPEGWLDAVTAVSGSGPGYLAVITEAMIDGGVQAGLPRSIATQLAVQTLLGTATLLDQRQLHPAQLKDQVTSPAGTTIAGISTLERGGIRGLIIDAIAAAQERSRQLGRTT